MPKHISYKTRTSNPRLFVLALHDDGTFLSQPKLKPEIDSRHIHLRLKQWAFSICKKKFGKFPLEISVWEERVPFVTSSIRGSRGRPGRLKDRERHGTGDKDEKSVNGTQVSTGKFPPGKRAYLFRYSVYSGTFSVERTKKSCSIYIPTGISGNFLQMENAQWLWYVIPSLWDHAISLHNLI